MIWLRLQLFVEKTNKRRVKKRVAINSQLAKTALVGRSSPKQREQCARVVVAVVAVADAVVVQRLARASNATYATSSLAPKVTRRLLATCETNCDFFFFLFFLLCAQELLVCLLRFVLEWKSGRILLVCSKAANLKPQTQTLRLATTTRKLALYVYIYIII